MEKKDIVIMVIIAVVAVIAIAAIVVVSDNSDNDGKSESYNLGTKEFVEDRIACDQTSLEFGDAGSITYSVSSTDSGWKYNGVTMYDVTIQVQVATDCTIRDISIRGEFSGSATLVEVPETNFSEKVYAWSHGNGFDKHWFQYAYELNSADSYLFKINAPVLLDDGDAELDLRFMVVYVDGHDTYSGDAEAEISIRQSATV